MIVAKQPTPKVKALSKNDEKFGPLSLSNTCR